MKNLSFGRLRHGPTSCIRHIFAATCFIFLSSSVTTHAQIGSHSYGYLNNIKHFPLAQVPGQDEYVMAGTIFDSPIAGPGINHVLFQHVDQDGNWNTFPSTNPFIYNNTGDDERAVDIVSDGTDFYITILQHNQPNASDKIKVMKVDVGGNPIPVNNTGGNNSWEIESTYPGYPNLFPIHSVYTNNVLYICGFAYDNYSGEPTLATDKQAFILAYDPNTNTATPVAATSFNSASGNRDFDMAMRIIPLWNGNIFLTGSCNSSNGPNTRSSVLALELDPNSLTIINDLSNRNSALPYDEYGVGLIEDPAGNTEWWLVGNTFTYNPSSNALAEVDARNLWVNHIDASIPAITTPNGRWVLDDAANLNNNQRAWGLAAMPHFDHAGANPGIMVVAGMQTGDENGCSPTYASDLSSVHTFLADFNFVYSGGMVNATINRWQTHMTIAGTGSGANDYINQGGGFSNTAWLSEMAIAVPTPGGPPDYKYRMTAPFWYQPGAPNPDFLAFKFLKGDPSVNLASDGCSPGSHNCIPGTSAVMDVDPLSVISEDPAFVNDLPQTEVETWVNDVVTWEESYCFNNVGIFREGNSVSQQQHLPVTVSIFPNPAYSYIQVNMSGTIEPGTPAIVELWNIYGQRITELYDGPADYITGTQMTLPDVATGMYMIKVYTNGKLQSQHKLSIE